jgi:hypothetical protein
MPDKKSSDKARVPAQAPNTSQRGTVEKRSGIQAQPNAAQPAQASTTPSAPPASKKSKD